MRMKRNPEVVEGAHGLLKYSSSAHHEAAWNAKRREKPSPPYVAGSDLGE
jgi:hypothetical protein